MDLFTDGTAQIPVAYKASLPSGVLVVKRTVLLFFALCVMGRPADSESVSSARVADISGSGGVPDGPPTSLQHTVSEDGLDSLSWSEVPRDQANGQIRSYFVRLDSSDPWDQKVREENVSSTHHVYTDLAPFTRYRAKVFAQNDAGRSARFAAVNFTTAPSPPPEPADLLASEVTANSVQISWNAPYPPHGVLDHYLLTYWRDQDPSRATNITVAQEECPRRRHFLARHCYTVKGLERATVYHFKVRAKNREKSFSPYSAELRVKTMLSGPPQNLHRMERTESSLKLTWYAPDVTKNGPTSYMVRARIALSSVV